jgi:hypothetical protein
VLSRFRLGIAFATLGVMAGCSAKSQLIVPMPAFDAETDAIDAMDVRDVIGEDVQPDLPRDAPTPCAEGTENVFVIGMGGELYEFNPATSSARFIANVPCAAGHGGFNSMAVARDGTAYAAAFDGSLVGISTRDGSCHTTPFRNGSFGVFCMGFALEGIDDVLFVSSCHAPPYRLGRIDTNTFALTTVGEYSPQPESGPELTGDRNGHVFGYWDAIGSIALSRIDPVTAAFVGVTHLTFRDFSSFAFAQWGGDFYFFANGVAGSDVVHYRPSDQSYAIVTHVPVTVVGAGVSTCAPGG